MADSRYRAALQLYREEVRGAVAAGRGAALEEQDVDPVLVSSQELENAAAQSLAAGDEDIRELGAQQFVGGAALDFAAAADLVSAADPSAVALEEPGSLFDQTYAELKAVMEAEPAIGVRATVAFAAGAALESDAAGAELAKAANAAIDAIAKDAQTVVKSGIDGLIKLPRDAILASAALAADRLLGPLYHGASLLVRRALAFLAKGVSKLLRLLGPFEQAARAKLKEWLGDFVKDKLVAFVVTAALETERLKDDVRLLVGDPPREIESTRAEGAVNQVQELAGRFGRHKSVVEVLAKVLGKIRGFVVGLGHWGLAAMAGIYLAIVAYGIWVAGDFLDWHRTREDGLLDLVAGVRSTVAATVTTPGA